VTLGHEDSRLERWLADLLATPGLTAVSDLSSARKLHVEDALTALPLITSGPVADVGTGGGSPGLPIAAARPDLLVDLVESSRKKCAFLEKVAASFPNVNVVCVRAEDHGRGTGRDAYGAVLARALAPPAVAVEWCVPLVRPGGIFVLYAGATTEHLHRAAEALAASPPEEIPTTGSRRLLVFRKLAPTPERFPRRGATARKRPLL
jgi:16S rRNA (guanine527-N7)-methyltransferase